MSAARLLRIALPLRLVLALVACSVVLACQRAPAELAATETSNASAGAATASQTERDLPRVIFLGDSLTAGFGLAAEDSFPAVLQRRLEEEGLPIRMVNAGVSGDTSRGGLNRVDWLLGQEPDVLVVALGGNDGLRAQPVENLRDNLREIVTRAQDAGAEVLLLGVELPPNYGPEYRAAFSESFSIVADELDVALVPSMLEGVGGKRDLNRLDGIHPNAEGQRLVAENVLPHLRELLR
jgi:acyl-CoA thioesterase-1